MWKQHKEGREKKNEKDGKEKKCRERMGSGGYTLDIIS